MTRPLAVPLPGNEALASRIAEGLGAELGGLETRSFPDGETYLRFRTDPRGAIWSLCAASTGRTRSSCRWPSQQMQAGTLGQPASALSPRILLTCARISGSKPARVVTSVSFARLLVHVRLAGDRRPPPAPVPDPGRDLRCSAPGVVHAASLIGDWITEHVPAPFVVGPDIESEQWVGAVAARAGAPYRVLRKERRGDRQVEITLPDLHAFREHKPVLVDDIVSSGRTMIKTARHLRDQGMPAPVCIAVHALFSREAHRALLELASRIVSTNAVPHETNTIDLSGLLVEQVAALLRG